MAMESTGSTRWEGDLLSGSGVTSLKSGVTGPMRVSWKARTEGEGGHTTPEELIAAAHASCFSMAFSAKLAKAGTPPETLDTVATVTFVPGEGITKVRLVVAGAVPGIAADSFRTLAEDAKENCPVSQALKGNVEIELEASLA